MKTFNAAKSVPQLSLLRMALLSLSLALGVFVTFDSLVVMVGYWQREEYSHSYLLPLLALGLFAQKMPRLPDQQPQLAWLGLLLLLFSLAIILAGNLSALYIIVQYGFILLLLALGLSVLGVRGALILWAGFVLLLFMVPLPNFLYNNLSQSLQLWSSSMGVFVIRLMDISVYLEGNVIDLGTYQLQVVEACSGLRYLFPLLSFGFLLAYLYQGAWWQRLIVILSTAPITVLMNSFRIGVIGILVEHWGIGMADGFLHYFEGWVIFISCIGLLMLEIFLLNRLFGAGGPVLDRFDLSFPEWSSLKLPPVTGWAQLMPLMACVLAIVVFGGLTANIENRAELQPERTRFTRFPLFHENWLGREGRIDSAVLQSLKLTDHLIADYTSPDYSLPVNLYVAYYGSQRKGASVHSPRSCIPGDGWVIADLSQKTLPTIKEGSGVSSLQVNRVLIQKGEVGQLVYYWFDMRGRNLTNEYLVKWYLFWDSLVKNRSDGALVRLVVPLPDGTDIENAEAELQEFIYDFYPRFRDFIPG
ncbi:MAG: VPLPA-CTERM-specific exosortase XrtD [Pseudomonadales bacterium]|nr:VPLPA-CTERM-specific exosortase XrtD [Pseudomonadales bacterium]